MLALLLFAAGPPTGPLLDARGDLVGGYLFKAIDDHGLHVRDAVSGKVVFHHQTKGHFGGQVLAFSADGKRLAARVGESADLWVFDVPGERLRTFAWHSALWQTAFSADGKRMAAQVDGALRLVDLNGGRLPALDAPSDPWEEPGTLTPDGQSLVTGRPVATRWELATGRAVPYPGVGPIEGRVAVCPDGLRAAGRSEPFEVRVWELGGGRVAHTFSASMMFPASLVAFGPGGQTLLATNTLTRVRRWVLRNGRAMEDICPVPDPGRDYGHPPHAGLSLLAAPSQTLERLPAAIRADAGADAAYRAAQVVTLLRRPGTPAALRLLRRLEAGEFGPAYARAAQG